MKDRIKYLESVTVDKLLITPFGLKSKFENLIDYFTADPVLANIALRDLIPNGLDYTPTGDSASEIKYVNQHNSGWLVSGEVAVSPHIVTKNANFGLPNL